MPHSTHIALSSFVALILLSVPARADLAPLVDRCPPATNAVVVVDSAQLMKGPLATRLEWIAAPAGGAAGAPRANSPLPFVGMADGLVLAMQWDVGQMEPAWEFTVLSSARGGPSIEALAGANGGYVDPVAGKPAAWFANNTGIVRLDDRTIGLFRPADRQLVARWVRNASAAPQGGVSDYLRRAAAQAGSATPYVFAIDLTDAFGEAGVRRAIDQGMVASLSGVPAEGEAELARLLAGARGATLALSATDPPRARLTLDFSADATRLGDVAKPLAMEVMSSAGLSLPDTQQWAFTVKGPVVAAEGTLSDDGVGRLLSLLDTSMRQEGDSITAAGRGAPKVGGARDASADAAQASGRAGAQAAPPMASQRYFKSVSSVLDGLKPGPSLGDSAGWLARDARRIDQLPTANVDPDLLAWGSDVSAKLRQSAALFSAGQARVRAASASAQLPAAYAPTGAGSGDAQQAAQARADRENARRQARQASAEARAGATTEGVKPLQDALESRGKIRAAMAQKYGVDF